MKTVSAGKYTNYLRLALEAAAPTIHASLLDEDLPAKDSVLLALTEMLTQAKNRTSADRAVQPLTASTNGGSGENSLSAGIPYAKRRACLQRNGDYWVIADANTNALLRHSKGLGYIAYLLRFPGHDIHMLDLITFCDTKSPRRRTPDFDLPEHSRGGGELLDQQAKHEYRLRMDELRDRLEVAKSCGSEEAAQRIEDELEQLRRELIRAGSPRRRSSSSDHAERARINVTRSIRQAIGRITENFEYLGRHLDRCIRTGTQCSYLLDGDNSIEWEL
jgi:hypothetical protein